MHGFLTAWRFVIFCVGLFDLGVGLALFIRIWRYAIPKTTARTILLGAGCAIGVCLAEVYDRLHSPIVTWRTPLVSTAVILLLIGEVRLYMWTRRPDGRKVRHRMIADAVAERMQQEVRRTVREEHDS